VASIFDQQTLDFISHSETQTCRLGTRLGELLEGGEIIALQGVGRGKTR
jgi:tRNA threonylcarbamoyladenosine biosynthesis protein TsaE